MTIKITKETAIETVRRWAKSATNTDQLECCALFVQDTIYTRFGEDDKEVIELMEYLNLQKKLMMGE